MRNVVIGPEAFTHQSYGGITRSECEIYNRLVRRNDLNVRLGMLYTHNAYLVNSGYSMWCDTHEGIAAEYQGAAMYTCKLLETADVYHPTWTDDQFNVIKQMGRTKVVFTVHDCVDERSNNSYAGLKRAWVERADHIVTPSECTRNQVLDLYPSKSPSEVTVIPHGAPVVCATDKLAGPPYILYVGGRTGYKNWDEFLRHSRGFLDRHPEVVVRCTGYALQKSEVKLIEELGLSNRVFHTRVQSDTTMWAVYANASMFVFPSSTEGFGMPVLEAMACGCPVILNEDCEVFHEVAGDVATYFSFTDDNLSDVEEYVYTREPDRTGLIKHASRFSWDTAAERYAQIYMTV